MDKHLNDLSAFAGALFGAFSSDWVKQAYENHIFIPIFTSFGFTMSLMCTIHCKSCSKFYEYHREARQKQEKKDTLSYSVVRFSPMTTFDNDGEDNVDADGRDNLSIGSDLEVQARQKEENNDTISYSVVRFSPMVNFSRNDGEDDVDADIRDNLSIDSDLESFDA